MQGYFIYLVCKSINDASELCSIGSANQSMTPLLCPVVFIVELANPKEVKISE
jgi:hypothetical protein